MDIRWASGCDGEEVVYTKGHVSKLAFSQSANKSGLCDTCEASDVKWTFKRYCRDFETQCQVLVDADEKTKGAFPVTWYEFNRSPTCHPNRPAVTLDGVVMDYCHQCYEEATEIPEERDDE